MQTILTNRQARGRLERRGGDRRTAQKRTAEGERWNRIFERNHGREMAEYYHPARSFFRSPLAELEEDE